MGERGYRPQITPPEETPMTNAPPCLAWAAAAPGPGCRDPNLAAQAALTGDKIATPERRPHHPPDQPRQLRDELETGKTIYNDPAGGAAAYAAPPRPDLILVSDIHGDHMDALTLGRPRGRADRSPHR